MGFGYYPIIRQRDEARQWLTQKSDDLDLAVRWPQSTSRRWDTDICGWRTTPVLLTHHCGDTAAEAQQCGKWAVGSAADARTFPMCKCSQFGRIALAIDQRLNHCPAAASHHIGKHRLNLDIGFLQRLLQALHMARLFPHQLLSSAQHPP